MKTSPYPLRLLMVEDNPSDAELLLHTLRTVGFDPAVRVVWTPEDFRSALSPDLDIILSDYTLPRFSGPDALAIVKEQGLDIPFIVISGTVGEDSAVAVMRDGATDYLLKDRLTRLGPAVESALAKRDLHRLSRANEARVRTLVRAVEQSADSIVITDANGAIEYVNPTFLRTTGYAMDEVIGRTPAILKSGHHDAAFYEQLWNTITNGGIFRAEFVNRKKNGDLYAEYQGISPVLDDNGAIVHFVSTGVDLTEQRRVESALRESEQQYRSVFESVPDAIFTASSDGTLTSLNPAFEQITGWACEAWLGHNFLELIIDEERRTAQENFRRILEGAEIPVTEFRVTRRTGGYATVEVLTVPNRTKEGVIGIARDVTERKLLEQQFLQAQKMESIGTLAGGIAHDFNNILGIILASSTMVERLVQGESVIQTNLGIIRRTVQRGAALVRQILTFARKSDEIKDSVDINELIKELTAMLRLTIPKTIEVRLMLEPDIPQIVSDGGQIHQTMMNLCINARDAILDVGRNDPSGTITITSRHHASRGEVEVRVRDTGKGMDEATRQRIFDPFFTTKEKGKGTGLGLAVVYGVMQGMHGSVSVESEPGKGAEFILRFPIHGERSDDAAGTAPPMEEVAGGKETLLLIEDEASLLQLATVVLESKGYTVMSALSGTDGVRTFLEHADRIDLVFTDYGLPGLDGAAVLQRIKEKKPGIRMLLASGYLEPDQRRQILDLGVSDIVQKPYEYNDILQKVRSVLDR